MAVKIDGCEFWRGCASANFEELIVIISVGCGTDYCEEGGRILWLCKSVLCLTLLLVL